VDEESDEYKNLINSLYEISKNDRLMQKHLGYYVKQKLINPQIRECRAVRRCGFESQI